MNSVDKRLFTGSTTKIVEATRTVVMRGARCRTSPRREGRGFRPGIVPGTFCTVQHPCPWGDLRSVDPLAHFWVIDGVIQEDVVDVGADDLSSGDATTLLGSAAAGLNADDTEELPDPEGRVSHFDLRC